MRSREENGCGKGELLVSVLYGEASASERAAFEAHAGACARCADELAAFGQVRTELQGWETGPAPAVRVEIRPSLAERLKHAFGIMPVWTRAAAAGAFALLVASAANLEVAVENGGFRVSTGLVPRAALTQTNVSDGSAGVSGPTVEVSDAEIARRIDAQVDEALRARLENQKSELSAELDRIQRQLAASQSNELRQMAARLQAQRRKIESLERDLDRQAGYGSSDLLFSSVDADSAPGS
jgi:hypothetical protein